MPVITIITGLLLSALGIWGRFFTEHGGGSITSLIPLFAGAPLVLLGLVALNERFLKHAMHLAAMIGCLGLLGAGGRLVAVLITKGQVEGPAAWATAVMTALCALFVLACVNSFLAARRRRRAREAPPVPGS
jgi:hypothetical protein